MDMAKHAAIFDLDGTLLNSIEDLYLSMNFVLKRNGFPERTLSEIRGFVGDGIYKLCQRALPCGTKNETVQRVFEEMHGYYMEHCMEKSAPYPGITRMLERLKAAGVKTAVVSNKSDDAVKKICSYYFGETVSTAIGEREQAGIRKKPAPDSVLAALGVLGVTAEKAVYIGDSQVDVYTAQNSGMDGIAVTWGFRTRAELERAGARVFADTPEKLFELICGYDDGAHI